MQVSTQRRKDRYIYTSRGKEGEGIRNERSPPFFEKKKSILKLEKKEETFNKEKIKNFEICFFLGGG